MDEGVDAVVGYISSANCLAIARSFQIPQLYTRLHVHENMLLALAAASGKSTGFWGPLYRGAWVEESLGILERFGLTGYAERPVSELPEGGRKLLDIALSFALKPRLLLMDEPASGVSIEEKFQVMDTLVRMLQQSEITTMITVHHEEPVRWYTAWNAAYHKKALFLYVIAVIEIYR